MAFVDATGLQIKTIEEIVDELGTQQRADLDPNLNTSADTPIGQMNGIFAAQLREVWEALQVAYNGFNPDAAEGFLLEKLSALTGTLREGATQGRVFLDCDLNAGTTLLAGVAFANVAGDPANAWTPINDFTAPGAGVFSVEFQAAAAGALTANAGTITDIATPVVGWNTVNNPLDATPGKNIDTDAELRTRREDQLRVTGSATVDAIRADVLIDPDVLQCSVFENVANVVDANGLPPKSIEVVVFDGTPPTLANSAIAQLIWDTKPAGIETFGFASGVATDSLGTFHTINFSRPTEIEIWVEMFISIDISTGYAGSAALKDALFALNNTDLLLGRDVIAARLVEVAMQFDGVFDMTSPPQLGLAPFPVGTANIPIGVRQIARLDTSRILVTETITPVP